jgi:hypothetical protein
MMTSDFCPKHVDDGLLEKIKKQIASFCSFLSKYCGMDCLIYADFKVKYFLETNDILRLVHGC